MSDERGRVPWFKRFLHWVSDQEPFSGAATAALGFIILWAFGVFEKHGELVTEKICAELPNEFGDPNATTISLRHVRDGVGSAKRGSLFSTKTSR